MKIMFVWENVNGLTSNYHDGGATMVIAESLDSARQLLTENGVKSSSQVFTTQPDFIAPIETDEDKVFIFPDAGCC